MLECKDIDAQMMDWLYDELDATSSAPFAEHVDTCSRCQTELDSLTRTRAALRELPDDEPSPSISQILLHEAAKRAPTKRARAASIADDEEKPGVFAWLFGWMKPVLAHPAAAVLACLVLVAGVAGSLYVRGKGRTTEPVAESSRTERAAGEKSDKSASPEQPALPADTTTSFEARLADEGYDIDDLAEGAAAPDGDQRAVADPEPKQELEEQGISRQSTPTRDRAERGDIARQKSEPAPPKANKPKAPVTNAVSTADPLLDAEDFDGDPVGYDGNAKEIAKDSPPTDSDKKADDKLDNTKSPAKKAEKKKSREEVADAPSGGSGGSAGATGGDSPTHTVETETAERELEWAKTQHKKMSKLIRAKKCKDAAVVANDILDRNPAYYYANIDKSAEIKRCNWYIVEEQRRRAQQRAKNRRSKAGEANDEMVEPIAD